MVYLALERYSRPQTAQECLELLSEGRAALLAGGTELNVRGHEELTHVIDLQALPHRGIAVDGEALEIGALTTLTELRRSEATGSDLLRAVREGAGGYAVLALQNRSTVGGRVVVDRGDQDLPPALLALGARVRLVRSAGEDLIDYPTGDARQALAGAVVTGVHIPLGEGRSALRRFGRTAVDAPLATVACASRPGEGIRLAANMRGPGANDLGRLSEAEALVASWNGERPADWRTQVREAVLGEVTPWTDTWASGEYRRDLTATLAVRSLAAVLGEEELA